MFHLPNGRRVKGQDLLRWEGWRWHDSAQLPGLRYVRLTARSPTYGPVTLVLVEQTVNMAALLCERAYFMEKGRVRFCGPPAALLQRPDLVRSVFLGAAARA